MCRVKDWDQVCFATRVRVSGECLFTVFSLKSVGVVGCLFISELEFFGKRVITKIKKASELTAAQMKALCMKKCKTGGRDVNLKQKV